MNLNLLTRLLAAPGPPERLVASTNATADSSTLDAVGRVVWDALQRHSRNILDVVVAVAAANAVIYLCRRVRWRRHAVSAQPEERFADVAGHDEAKEELREVVALLRSSERYKAAGATLPRGVLLSGDPGIGKTLLARALAGEAGLPFLHASASSFVEVWVGQGAKNVRALFAQARARAPCVLFIDELDAVGAARGTDRHSERDQTVDQLLVELDGCPAAEARQRAGLGWFRRRTDGCVLVIAATNRADALDAALVRPGRFDVHVQLQAPDAQARESILRLHAQDKTLSSDVDLAAVSRRTRGFTGAALSALVNTAAIIAVRRGRVGITSTDLDAAFDRAVIGLERACSEDTHLVALHEAGHAIVAVRLLGDHAVHKVSVVARGATGGVTVLEPPGDLPSRDELEKRLAVTLGGRAAEECCLGRRGVTAAAVSDLEAARGMARAMVERWGLMGSALTVAADASDASQAAKARADREVAKLLHRAHRLASRLLGGNRRGLRVLAAELVERKSMSGAEVARIIANRGKQ
jgi:cell division protease FtsH